MAEFDDLDQILSRYLEGEISADELAQLEARLESDEAFADHFSRWCLMHRQVTELLSEDILHQLMDQFVTGSPALPKSVRSQWTASASGSGDRSAGAKQRLGRSGWRGNLRGLLGALGLATAATVVASSLWWWAGHGRTPDGQSTFTAGAETPSADRAEMIATLTRLVDGVWQPDEVELAYGQQLKSGDRVALLSGMAKVTFECGAEVVLEGPCDFVVQSPMVGVLNSGKMTADVPRRAFAFAILSPDVDFVDLGTSFGVTAGADRRTELHVFEGEVLCSQTKQIRERNEILHVTAKKAVEFDSVGGIPSDIAMDEAQFSQLIALRRTVGAEPQRVVPDKLALWLAADAAVSTDTKERVISWRDIIYGDNTSAEDALQADEQARPLLVSDAVNGQPALRFDGDSDFLLTTPLETTDDQTVLFVCQFSKSAFNKDRIWGGQILNYDGPPSRYLSNTLEPGVLQIGEPLLEEEFKPSLITGQVFAGFIGSAVVESGRLDAEPVGDSVPVVVSYRYDYGNGQSELVINGRSFGTARAFAPQGITSRKIIGRHAWMQNYFHGDLAELLIYNKALSPSELADSTAYLAEKYSISLDE